MKRIATLGAPSLLGKGMQEVIKEAFADEGFPLTKDVRNHTLMTVFLPEIRVWLAPHFEVDSVKQVTFNNEEQLRRILTDMEQHAELCQWPLMLTVEDVGQAEDEASETLQDEPANPVETAASEVDDGPVVAVQVIDPEAPAVESAPVVQGEQIPSPVLHQDEPEADEDGSSADAAQDSAAAPVVAQVRAQEEEKKQIEPVAPVEKTTKAAAKKTTKGVK